MKRIILKAITLALVVFPLTSMAQVSYETKASHAILVDDATGTVLFEKNADEQMHPSSMSKLMTTYMLFDQLKKGALKLDDTFIVNETAWSKQGSKMFVPIHERVAIEDLIKGIVIQSGNDACIVVAEGIAGSEGAFAQRMNARAKEIGLTNSNFVNATGWPDDQHLMTARDLAILAHHLIHDFPEYYHYFSQPEYVYNGIRQFNRNMLLDRNIGADGLKTGHTEIAGYGLTASAVENGRRLVAVVNGLGGTTERADETERLLRYGFRNFENKSLFNKDEVVEEAPVWFGKQETVPLTVQENIVTTVPTAGVVATPTITVQYNSPVPAPIKKGDHIADLVIAIPGTKERKVPLVAAADVGKLSGLSHMVRAARYYVGG